MSIKGLTLGLHKQIPPAHKTISTMLERTNKKTNTISKLKEDV